MSDSFFVTPHSSNEGDRMLNEPLAIIAEYSAMLKLYRDAKAPPVLMCYEKHRHKPKFSQRADALKKVFHLKRALAEDMIDEMLNVETEDSFLVTYARLLQEHHSLEARPVREFKMKHRKDHALSERITEINRIFFFEAFKV